jgi:hypothetical protein
LSDYPLAVIPFATSIVLVIGSPDAEPAQPRALIGLAMLQLTGAARMGRSRRGRIGNSRDVCHRHVSPAGGDQSAAGDFL